MVDSNIEVGYLEQTAVSGSDNTVWEEARSRMTQIINAEASMEAAEAAAERGQHYSFEVALGYERNVLLIILLRLNAQFYEDRNYATVGERTII